LFQHGAKNVSAHLPGVLAPKVEDWWHREEERHKVLFVFSGYCRSSQKASGEEVSLTEAVCTIARNSIKMLRTMPSSALLRRVAFVRSHVSEERIDSIIKVTVFLRSVLRLLVTAANVVLISPILFILMM
jgi:hypothetical protein